MDIRAHEAARGEWYLNSRGTKVQVIHTVHDDHDNEIGVRVVSAHGREEVLSPGVPLTIIEEEDPPAQGLRVEGCVLDDDPGDGILIPDDEEDEAEKAPETPSTAFIDRAEAWTTPILAKVSTALEWLAKETDPDRVRSLQARERIGRGRQTIIDRAEARLRVLENRVTRKRKPKAIEEKTTAEILDDMNAAADLVLAVEPDPPEVDETMPPEPTKTFTPLADNQVEVCGVPMSSYEIPMPKSTTAEDLDIDDDPPDPYDDPLLLLKDLERDLDRRGMVLDWTLRSKRTD
jgi:hypothetical protein